MKPSPPTLIYCADGNSRFAGIALSHGFRYGAQLPNTVYHLPHFVDQKWRSPNFDRYMQSLEHYQPALATVLDWERWEQFARVIWWAIHAARYVTEAVIIIPKIPGSVRFIPRKVGGKPVRLGYSVPTRFSATFVSITEFLRWPHGVHLLGGSPEKQMRLAGVTPLALFDHLPKMDVRSVDINYHLKMATRYNQYWVPGTATYARNHYWPTLVEADGQLWGDGDGKSDAPYEAFRRSCQNIVRAWGR